MKKRKRRRNEHQVVVVEQVSAPDAQERLARAFDLILSAARRPDGIREQGGGVGESDDEEGGVGDVETK